MLLCRKLLVEFINLRFAHTDSTGEIGRYDQCSLTQKSKKHSNKLRWNLCSLDLIELIALKRVNDVFVC